MWELTFPQVPTSLRDFYPGPQHCLLNDVVKPESTAVLLCLVNISTCVSHRRLKITKLIPKLIISLHVLVPWKLLSPELYSLVNDMNICPVAPLETWEAFLPASFPVSSSSLAGVCALYFYRLQPLPIITSVLRPSSSLSGTMTIVSSSLEDSGCNNRHPILLCHVVGMSVGRICTNTTLVGS